MSLKPSSCLCLWMSDAVAAWEHLPRKESSVSCKKGAEESAFRGWPCRVWAGPVFSLLRWTSIGRHRICSCLSPRLPPAPTLSCTVGIHLLQKRAPSMKREGTGSQTTDGYWRPPPLGHLSPEIPLGRHPFDIVSGIPQPCNLSQGALEATLLTSRSGQPAGGAGDG